MASLHVSDDEGDPQKPDLRDLLTSQHDLQTQATISVVLGLFAFLAFCVSQLQFVLQGPFELTSSPSQLLRTRWTGLYAARKKQKNEATRLPQLPDTFFGWIPVLYKITDEEVLASAGLDAFVVGFRPKGVDVLC